MSTARKTLEVCFRAAKLTSDVFRQVLAEFNKGNIKPKGKMSLKQLNAHKHGKIDNIEVNDKNIGDFISTAAKYDINFAVKCDKVQNPPMWYVFFDTSDTRNFKRAFTEYANKAQAKSMNKNNRSLVKRLEKVDKEINAQKKQISRNRDKDRKKERNEPSL